MCADGRAGRRKAVLELAAWDGIPFVSGIHSDVHRTYRYKEQRVPGQKKVTPPPNKGPFFYPCRGGYAGVLYNDKVNLENIVPVSPPVKRANPGSLPK